MKHNATPYSRYYCHRPLSLIPTSHSRDFPHNNQQYSLQHFLPPANPLFNPPSSCSILKPIFFFSYLPQAHLPFPKIFFTYTTKITFLYYIPVAYLPNYHFPSPLTFPSNPRHTPSLPPSPGSERRTKYGCEGSSLEIECEEGTAISLVRANYGRFSISICNKEGNTAWSVNCMEPRTLRVINKQCR